MVRSIPRALLIHSVVHRYNPSEVDYGVVTWGGERSIKHVRVEPSTKLVISKENKQVQLAALLNYCARNSSPQGIAFTLGDEIEFEGVKYTVVVVDRLYDDRKLHHLEVGLI